jgi:hypothetical protein
MTSLVLVVLLLVAMLGAILAVGARHRADPRTVETGLRAMLRDDGIVALRARLDDGPEDVTSTRVSAFRNSVVLDLGDVRLAARCYRPPDDGPIWQLVALTWQSYVGWVLDVNGPRGHRRIAAWDLALTPA